MDHASNSGLLFAEQIYRMHFCASSITDVDKGCNISLEHSSDCANLSEIHQLCR